MNAYTLFGVHQGLYNFEEGMRISRKGKSLAENSAYWDASSPWRGILGTWLVVLVMCPKASMETGRELSLLLLVRISEIFRI